MVLTGHPRHRLITFRLSAEEYDAVLVACQAEGARTISEYARESVLGRIGMRHAAPHLAANWMADIKEDIEQLSRTTTELATLIRSSGQPAAAPGGAVSAAPPVPLSEVPELGALGEEKTC